MKYIFCLCFLFLAVLPSFADIVQLTNLTQSNEYIPANYLRELSFAEMQVFQESKKNESVLSKLEKLEIALFGAIQAGETAYRIGNVYRSCKNIYDGGYGLRYITDSKNFYHTNRIPKSRYNHYKSQYRNAYRPYLYNDFQLLPKNYSLGTGVKIID